MRIMTVLFLIFLLNGCSLAPKQVASDKLLLVENKERNPASEEVTPMLLDPARLEVKDYREVLYFKMGKMKLGEDGNYNAFGMSTCSNYEDTTFVKSMILAKIREAQEVGKSNSHIKLAFNPFAWQSAFCLHHDQLPERLGKVLYIRED